MAEDKNQEQIKIELENKYKEEIKKLQDKIIELYELITTKEKEKEQSIQYYLKLSSEYSEKSRKISDLEYEIFKMKAVMARQWDIPLEETEKRLVDKLKELGIN